MFRGKDREVAIPLHRACCLHAQLTSAVRSGLGRGAGRRARTRRTIGTT
jgi:hypothetical protein